ncbi:GNAT family N-acetyltransferase [Halobacillus yeomjeoni]|uniref:GNAT family N-acetyltransferase n=1 Tax=Halobacillus yeomjeoni TaxID=311194 RepID=UPI001CD1F57C|nr:GNAT family N-acetyltransferase [Halobacillus yeomjeoni]MCA0983502.1 GNAT family N-acetyltransferase [Halobacillus yeomjeoni]
MSHVSICEFSEAYEKQVSELILHIQQEEYNIEITKDDQPDLMNIPAFYQVRKGNFWVAEIGGRVVGTISLLDIGNNEVALRKMFVAEEYRGSSFKIALRLLNRAISWAADHSIKTIFLGTTPQFLAAHRFYQKNGFIKIDQKELPSTFPIVKVDKFFYKFQVENAAE